MTPPDADRDPLEVLAADFIERQRRGESPAIAEYAAQDPDLAEEIRDVFPTIAAIEQLKVEKEEASGARVALARSNSNGSATFAFSAKSAAAAWALSMRHIKNRSAAMSR